MLEIKGNIVQYCTLIAVFIRCEFGLLKNPRFFLMKETDFSLKARNHRTHVSVFTRGSCGKKRFFAFANSVELSKFVFFSDK